LNTWRGLVNANSRKCIHMEFLGTHVSGTQPTQ
jgi:hypothetical protein